MKLSKKSPDAQKPDKKAKGKVQEKKSKATRGGRKIVGLELDSHYIRTVEFNTGSARSFTKFHEEELEEGIVRAGDVLDPSALANVLVKIWKEQKYSTKEVHIAVNSENSFATPQTMDDEQDFAKILPFRIPVGTFDPDEFYLGFHNLNRYQQEERDTSRVEGYRVVDKRDILLVGVRRDEVTRITTAFKKAKLFPVALDISALAMLRAAPTKTMEDAIDVHVQVSSDSTLVVVSHKQQPVYLRNIEQMGDNLIKSRIVEAMEIEPDYARELQLKAATMSVADVIRAQDDDTPSVFGDDEEDDDSKPSRYSEDQLNAYEIVQKEIGEIIRGIDTTIVYFSNSNHLGLGDRFGRFILSGDTTVLNEIQQRITAESSLNVEISSPLEMLKNNGYTFGDDTVNNIKQERFAVALGAAISSGEVQD